MERSLEESLKEVEGRVVCKAPPRDYRKVMAIYACGAPEHEEVSCERYMMGALGCVFQGNISGLRTCNRTGF